MSIPFHETWLLDIGIVVLIMVAFSIISFFILRILDVLKTKKDRQYEEEGCSVFLLKFLLLNSLLIFGLVFIGFAILVQSFHDFNNKTLIAKVTCEKIDQSDNMMRFIIVQEFGDNAGIAKQFYLQGDKWYIKGDIINWKDGLKFLGWHSWYRIVEVGGITLNKKSRPLITHNLANDSVPSNWKWLYNVGKKMPLIQGLYGKRLTKPPNYNKRFEIYVTATGFSVKTVARN